MKTRLSVTSAIAVAVLGTTDLMASSPGDKPSTSPHWIGFRIGLPCTTAVNHAASMAAASGDEKFDKILADKQCVDFYKRMARDRDGRSGAESGRQEQTHTISESALTDCITRAPKKKPSDYEMAMVAFLSGGPQKASDAARAQPSDMTAKLRWFAGQLSKLSLTKGTLWPNFQSEQQSTMPGITAGGIRFTCYGQDQRASQLYCVGQEIPSMEKTLRIGNEWSKKGSVGEYPPTIRMFGIAIEVGPANKLTCTVHSGMIPGDPDKAERLKSTAAQWADSNRCKWDWAYANAESNSCPGWRETSRNVSAGRQTAQTQEFSWKGWLEATQPQTQVKPSSSAVLSGSAPFSAQEAVEACQDTLRMIAGTVGRIEVVYQVEVLRAVRPEESGLPAMAIPKTNLMYPAKLRIQFVGGARQYQQVFLWKTPFGKFTCMGA